MDDGKLSLSSAHGDSGDWGDFVDSSDEDEIQMEVERVHLYEQGWYYPICIGDLLVNRYRIEHKLGHGGFSTVWMALDTLRNRDVALKIITPGHFGEDEYSLHNRIISNVQDISALLLYRETFLLRSPHGDHRVLVFPVQGPNLRDHLRQKPAAVCMSASRQLLQSLKSLHDAGFVHRG